jgi:hypothetical protein
MTDDYLRMFFDAAASWICDGYSLDVRYIADNFEREPRIWDASITLNPLPPSANNTLRLEAAGILVGQVQEYPASRQSLVQVLEKAAKGLIPLAGCSLEVAGGHAPQYYSEMSYRDRWFSDLHLRVDGSRRTPPSVTQLARIDNVLRALQPPFDGLSDVAGWLGLTAPGMSPGSPAITIRVDPPVDLMTDRCNLRDDVLTIVLHAHPKLDVARIGLAIRAVPGHGLDSRLQAAASIKWKRAKEGRREGVAEVHVSNADQALAILSMGESMVRRHWLIDPAKARNNRHLAVSHFDKDLKMLKEAVLETQDSRKFEAGVAGLLFLHGFTPALQLETDAPDLVVATPLGRLAIVECTTRVSDLGAKVGKLVDRRGSLTKALAASGHPAQVISVLVCRQPRDQIATQAIDLPASGVLLLSTEQLEAGLERSRFPGDPDQLLSTAFAQLSTPRQAPSNNQPPPGAA